MARKPKKNPLQKHKLTLQMREALFHAESGQEGYTTPKNHDMPADRILDYQHPMVIQALKRRRLIQGTRNPDFPWKLTRVGRRVGRWVVMEVTKQQYFSLPTP